MAEATGPTGSRQPGSRPRRVISAPTGAPGEPFEGSLPTWADDSAAAPATGPAGAPGSAGTGTAGGSADERAWAAEAERLLADRPPHWA